MYALISLRLPATATLLLLLAAAAARGQAAETSDGGEAPSAPRGRTTVRIAAGPHYRAAGLHRWLLGPNYRRLWTTPIEVEVLNLRDFAGGLKATKKGGGKQTKSLRFDAADGREFRVRSVDKDPEAALPPEYRETAVLWIAQDQISAANPAGPLVIDGLQEGLGMFHVSHRFVVIPDDPALGEFRKEFAGMLGLLEESPRTKPPVTPGFEEVEEIFDGEEAWPWAFDAGLRVDGRALLRARLLDMFVGDWDRHQRQWDWARVKGKPLLQPIALDRDQAFARFDGALLAVARMSNPRFVKFDDQYPPPDGLNWNGRFLDRRFLSPLSRADWVAEALRLQRDLTDELVERAVRRMPPEYVALVGRSLVEDLKARRAQLPEYAREYYEVLAREAEVWGTDGAEAVEVVHNEDGTVEVRVGASGEAAAAGPVFQRLFRPEETSEVRLFLLGGDDRVVTRGDPDPGVKVRVVGSGGNDVMDDRAAGGTRFYDAEGRNQTLKGPGTADSNKPYAPDVDYVGDPLRDWGHDTGPALWLSAGPDVGLLVGLKLQRTSWGFRKHPHRYVQSVGVLYSTALSGLRADYEGDFLRTNSRKRFNILARASGIEQIRFHGFGNETVALEDGDFYRSDQRLYLFRPRFRLGLEDVDLWLGPTAKFTTTQPQPDHFIALARPYGVGDFGVVGVGANFVWDRRNRRRAADRGTLVRAEGNVYPAVWSAQSPFGEVHGDAAGFLSADWPLDPTLALRVGGKHVWGRYPFHESAFVGGPDTVRGLRIQRYAGDGAAWGNAELRLRLLGFNFLVPGDLGVFGVADAGRVFLEGEDSDRWHTGVGGGVWLSFLKRENTVTLTAAHSEGRTRFYLGAGFAF